MTHTLLQFDFPMDGPWGRQMAEAFLELAEDIANEQGLVWKIWTENETEKRAGGIYLFSDADAAARYLNMHSARLAAFGVSGVVARTFQVNETLSAITRAPIDP